MFDSICRISIEFTKSCNFACSYCHQNHESGILSLSDLSDRVNFINSMDNIDRKCLDITLTGGEVTMFPEVLEKYFYYLSDNIKSNYKKFTLMSNMSNLEIVLKLLEKGILRKDRVGFSWDGINNNRTRVSKYDNNFFIENLKKLSRTQYKNTVTIQIAITKETLPNLNGSVSILYNMGLNNLALYVINGIEYTEEDAKIYDTQMCKISELFIKSYTEDMDRLRIFSMHKCFRDYVVRYASSKEDTTRCRKIGQALHFTMDGGIYPCIYFGDHDIMRIGDIRNGLDHAKLDDFTDEYFKTPDCIADCNIRHCLSCPAVSYLKRGSFSKRDLSHCKMYAIEKKWFDYVASELSPYITPCSIRDYWGRVYEPS